MKTKILAVLMGITLGFTLIGCGAAPADPIFPNTDVITTGTVPPSGDGTAEPPADTNFPNDTDSDNAPEDKTDPTEEGGEETPPIADTSTPPATAAKTDVLLRCTASSLNVRQGAGTSFAVIGSLDKGDMVMPISKSGGWYEIWYLGGSAYVSASYLTEASFDKASDRIEKVIAEGKKLLGIPYDYGAQRYHFGNGSLNPKFDGKSYDCSSLMQYIFKIGADVDLAMTSREQSLQGEEIPRAEIKRGDLLFFTNASRYNNTGLERIGHVALYLGDNMILHTASDHAVIEAISDTRNSYFITARRVTD